MSGTEKQKQKEQQQRGQKSSEKDIYQLSEKRFVKTATKNSIDIVFLLLCFCFFLITWSPCTVPWNRVPFGVTCISSAFHFHFLGIHSHTMSKGQMAAMAHKLPAGIVLARIRSPTTAMRRTPPGAHRDARWSNSKPSRCRSKWHTLQRNNLIGDPTD